MNECPICGGRSPGITCFHTWGDIQGYYRDKRQEQLRKEEEERRRIQGGGHLRDRYSYSE
jgi:hypothetical protein